MTDFTPDTNPQAFAARPSLWNIAGPSIMVFMLATLAGLALLKIVAPLGTSAVAAVSAGQRVNFMLVALIMGMGSATTALISQAWGARNLNLVVVNTRLSLLVGCGLTLVLSLFFILLAPQIATFLKLKGETYDFAVAYIRWLSLFTPVQAVVLIMSTACRAIGDAKSPLYIGSISYTLGVFVAWILATGAYGAPMLEVKGAAVGWGISFVISAVFYVILWTRGRLSLPNRLITPRPAYDLPRFIKIGLPATMEQLMLQSAMLMFIAFVASYGAAPFAAYGVGLGIFGISVVVGMGLSIACSALVGQALGAGDIEGAVNSARHALKTSLIVLGISGVLSMMLARQMAELMVDDPEVIKYTTGFLILLGVLQPLLAFEFALVGAMRGAGDTRFPLYAGMFCILLVRLPLAAFFNWFEWSVYWIYGVFIVDQCVKNLLVVRRFKRRRWLKRYVN